MHTLSPDAPPVSCQHCEGSGVASVSHVGGADCKACEGEGYAIVPAHTACPWPPGSWQKLAWLQVRQSRGEPLFQAGDATADAWDAIPLSDRLDYRHHTDEAGTDPLETDPLEDPDDDEWELRAAVEAERYASRKHSAKGN